MQLEETCTYHPRQAQPASWTRVHDLTCANRFPASPDFSEAYATRGVLEGYITLRQRSTHEHHSHCHVLSSDRRLTRLSRLLWVVLGSTTRQVSARRLALPIAPVYVAEL